MTWTDGYGPSSGPNPGPICGARVCMRRISLHANVRFGMGGGNSKAPSNGLSSIVFRALNWRRGWESNPRIKVLQTSALPLGYRAPRFEPA